MIKAAVAVAAVAAVVAGGASARPSGVQEACARHAPKRAVREATSDDNLGTIVTHSSGLIRLGINNEGNLNWGPRDGFNARASIGGISPYGLRYVDADPGHILDPSNTGAEYESTAPGCLCEGWGAGAWDTSGNYLSGGSADDAQGYYGLSDVAPTVVTPANDDRAQNATTAINAGSCLRVEHHYFPSTSRYLYQVDVRLTNICNFGLGQVKYTRKMDWDMEPTAFSETVELNPGNAADLECLHDNGFASAEVTQNPVGLMTGCVSTNTLLGASDHGAYFRFNFRDVTTATPLAAGASKTLTTFYGAAPTRDLALAALSAVGAEAYSFGHSTEAFPFGDNGYTSIFAFAGVGGDVVIPPGNTYTAPCGAAAGGSCAHSRVSTTGKDVFLQFAKTGVFTATCQP